MLRELDPEALQAHVPVVRLHKASIAKTQPKKSKLRIIVNCFENLSSCYVRFLGHKSDYTNAEWDFATAASGK